MGDAETNLGDGKNKIGLVMILGNESRIIKRCLDSAKPVIDFVSVCCNGQDDTEKIVNEWLTENKVPGEIHKTVWKDFGHNRTESFYKGRETAKSLGIKLDDCYFLLLDADMVLHTKKFLKKKLYEKGYLVNQYAGGTVYPNVRLTRADCDWICDGCTHEVWVCPKFSSRLLDTLFIDDRNDGGSKSDKYPRDERLLLQGLKDRPNSERYVFYLAQTYICWGPMHHDKAIDWYKKRVTMGGFWEEIYYSYYQLGCLFRDKKDPANPKNENPYWEEAQKYFLLAYDKDPRRAEPLFEIAKYHRMKGQNQLAYMFAEKAAKLSMPKEALFLTQPIYDYWILEELSIAGFYTADRRNGFIACDRLHMHPRAPMQARMGALANVGHYIEYVPTKLMPIHASFKSLEGSQLLSSVPMNPSLVPDSDVNNKGGFYVNCRTVNYYMRNRKQYMMGENGQIQTYNFHLRYDKDLNLISKREVVDGSDVKKYSSNVIGFEDSRIFRFNGGMYALTATKEYHCADMKGPLQTLIKYENDSSTVEIGTTDPIKVTSVIPLKSPKNADCEKNWLPFVDDGKLMVIYNYQPFTVMELSEDGEMKTVIEETYSLSLYDWRGSAAPVRFNNGWLFMVHEVRMDGENRMYYSRFVYMDNKYTIKKYSLPFLIVQKGIEYVAGMVVDDNRIILGFGLNDREAYLCIMDTLLVNKLLEITFD
jgi:predicted GH43/DUF377 family glycosyl hydrolase